MKANEILVAVMVTVLAGIFLGYLFPVGMDAFNDANTTGWDSATSGIWSVIPIMLVLIPLAVLMGWVILSLRQN